MKCSHRPGTPIAICECGFIFVAVMAILINSPLTLAQEITVTRINLDQTTLRHLSTGQFLKGKNSEDPTSGKASIFQTLREQSPPGAVGNAGNPGFFLIFDPSLPIETNGEAVEHAVGHLINTDAFIDAVVIVPGPDPLVNGTIEVLRNLGNGPGGWLGLESHTILTVGREPSGVTIGDLNGDGQPDIAVSNAGDGNIMIFFNDAAGTGAFGAPVVTPVDEGGGERPLSIVAADLDGLGLIDLVVGNGVTNKVTIFLNDPAPPFQAGAVLSRAQDIAVGIDPVEVCPIDTDNDKDLDLLVSNFGENTVSVLKNGATPFQGTDPFDFTQTVTLHVGSGPLDITAGKIDNDLFPDIVSSNADGTITIILNNGSTFDNSLPAITLGISARSVDIGDFDNDGNSDLTVVANAPTNDPYLIPQKTRPGRSKYGQDLVGDPTVFAPAVLLIENLGSASGSVDLAEPLNLKVTGEPNFVVNADFNNDGIIDFSTSNNTPLGGTFTIEVIPPDVFLPPPSPTGACCLAGGSCLVDTLANCLAAGGLYQGDNFPCFPNPCPQPTGACCLSGALCLDLSAVDCTSFGGVFQGPGTTCAGDSCGACCLLDTTCIVATVSICTALGGTFQGDGTTCTVATCFNCIPGPPPPPNNTYDVTLAVGTDALGFFLVFDPSLPGAPDDIVNFDGVPETTRTDLNGTVVTIDESDVAGVGATHTITITASSPLGTDIFPGGLTSGGFPLTDGAIFIGILVPDLVDTDPGSIIDSANLEFFTNGVSVAGPFDVANLIADHQGVWDGTMSVTLGGLAGFGANGWTLIVQVTEDLNGCPPGICPTDIDPPGGNGVTDMNDLDAALNNCGAFGPPRPLGDVSPVCGDWVVNLDDIILILGSFGPCPFVPGNTCPDAIIAVTGANPFDNTGFTETLAPGVNQCESGNPQLDDIWFIWTAPAGANPLNVTADLCGTSFDSALSVFPNDCLLTTDPFNALGCDDDNAATCPGTSQPQVTWIATPGFSYLLVASGWQGGGIGSLNITATEITNDDCTGALPLTINGAFIAGNNTGALTEVPAAPDCGPSTDGHSSGTAPVQSDGGTWFSVTGTGNVLKANTCDPTQVSFYFTFINIYCGGCPLQFCVGDSADIPCGFGPYAELNWCSALGEPYLILIHGSDLFGAPELFSLRVEDALIPCANAGSCNLPGDTCNSAGLMTFNPVTQEHIALVDNTLMTTTIPALVGDCGGNPGTFGGTEGSKDQWFTFTSNSSGIARVDTCGSGFDTIINLWEFPPGGECVLTNANIVVCNDDATNGGSDTCGIDPPPISPFFSGVEVQITAGIVYHLSVSEWGSGGFGGTTQLRVIENFVGFGACQVGAVCTPGVTLAVCNASCGEFFPGAACLDVPTGACCMGGACLGITSRQACGINGSSARYTDGAVTCIGLNCADSCVASVASNGGFNGNNGVRPTAGLNVLGVMDDFTLDVASTLTSINLGMIYNVAGGIASGAVQYEITIYELGTPGIVGSACDAPTIADLVSSTTVPVAGPVMLTGVTLTLGGPAFGGHNEIVDGNFPVPINLAAGRYAMMVRVLDDPQNLFWGTANGAADGSSGESAIFGTDNTVPPPVDVNAPDGQRDHAFCIN